MSEQIGKSIFKITNDIQNSLTFKIFNIGILILILLIPLSMVRDLIRERERTQTSAIQEVSSKWGNEQIIKGPVLVVPYTIYSKVYKNKEDFELFKKNNFAYFLPETLNIDGMVNSKTRYRGIYEVPLYDSNLKISGTFKKPDFKDFNILDEDILWDKAFISMGITDLRGIKEKVDFLWNGEKKTFNPGIPTNSTIQNGIHDFVSLSKNQEYKFSFNILFNGSSTLNFIPLGEETNVEIKSDWKSPSFIGAFLPDNRDINEKGFKANWKVLNLNRSYPQKFLNETNGINESSFGIRFIIPVNEYQKNLRSAKYGILFIALTFIAFFFIQIINKISIHTIQYFLVGLALCIFYTLLISLSEHIGFNYSYLLSSILVISLISIYSTGFFKSKFQTVLITSILGLLYLFIFIIIQLIDYSLLVGSLGLFAILSSIMIFTRNINWYSLNNTNKES